MKKNTVGVIQAQERQAQSEQMQALQEQEHLRAWVADTVQKSTRVSYSESKCIWNVQGQSKSIFELPWDQGLGVHVQCVYEEGAYRLKPIEMGYVDLGSFEQNRLLFDRLVGQMQMESAVGFLGYPMYGDHVCAMLFGMSKAKQLADQGSALDAPESVQWIQNIGQCLKIEKTSSGPMLMGVHEGWSVKVSLAPVMGYGSEGWLEWKKAAPLRPVRLNIMVDYERGARPVPKASSALWTDQAARLGSGHFAIYRSIAQLRDSEHFMQLVGPFMEPRQRTRIQRIQTLSQLVGAISPVEPALASAMEAQHLSVRVKEVPLQAHNADFGSDEQAVHGCEASVQRIKPKQL